MDLILHNKWIRFLFYLLGTCIISSYAFSNNYPFVYSDTGTYIRSGFTDFFPPDRPVFYGMFLRHVSLAETFWLPALAQAFFVFWLITLYFKKLVSEKYDLLFANVMAIFLMYFTGVGYHALQLIPDIFSGIIILSMIALVTFPQLKIGEKVFLWILIVLSLLFHTSNILILGFFFGILFLLSFRSSFLIYRKISLLFLGIGMSVYFLLPSLNYLAGGKYENMPYSHLFIMGRLSETGILGKYLDDKCNEKNYRLCKHKDHLPTNATQFIFGIESPVFLEGGADTLKAEHSEIMKEVFTSPSYLKMFFIESVKGTFGQFFKFSAGDGFIASYQEDSPPYREIHSNMKHEIGAYASSRQFARQIDFWNLNNRQYLIVMLSLVFICFALVLNDEKLKAWRHTFLFTLLLLIGNAWSCATFANAIDRLQARVIWILPFIVFLFLVFKYKEKLIGFISSSDKAQ